ncbi:hypothetical protein D3C73_999580 [compost metagenome]
MAPNFIINGKTINTDKNWKVKYSDNAPEQYITSMTEAEKQFIKDHNLDYPTQIFEDREHYSINTSLIDPVQADPTSDISAIEQKIKTYLDTNIARVIYSKDEAAFTAAKDKFITDLKGMDIDKVMDFYKNGFEENKKKLADVQ